MKCRFIFPLIALFSICLFTVSCSDDDENEGIIVAVLKDNVNSTYWQQVANGITDGAKQNDVISVITYTKTDDDATSQISTLQGLKQNYGTRLKGIILSPSNATVESAAVSFDVPVVIVDTPLSEDSPLANIYHSFLATDNVAAGIAMSSYISADASEILVVQLQSSAAITNRVQGFLSEKAGATVLLVNDDDCSDQISAALENNPSFTTVFAANGSTAAFAILATEDLTGISVYAFDASDVVLQAIRDNKVAGTMAQDTYGMGYNAVEAIYNPYVTKDQYLDAFLITKINMDTDEAKRYINVVE